MHGTTIKRRIFEEIVEYVDLHGISPTQNYIHDCFCGMTDDVGLHLERLAHEGLIKLEADEAGSIVLLDTIGVVPSIEMRGSVSPRGSGGEVSTMHGAAVLDLRNVGVYSPPGMHGFQVLNDDMVDAGIFLGDIAVLADLQVAQGDIVVVEIEGRWVLRRYVVIKNIPHLIAENALCPSLLLACDSPIMGVLWGVIRAQIAAHSPRGPQRRFNYANLQPVRSEMFLDEVTWPPKDEQNQGKPSKGAQLRRNEPKPPCIIPKSKQKSPRRTGSVQRATKLPPPPEHFGLNEPGSNYTKKEETDKDLG